MPGTYVVRGEYAERRGRPSIALDGVIITPPPDTFILGSTRPDSTNSGAGVIRAYPTTVITPSAADNYTVTLSGNQSLVDTIVHGMVKCTGANTIENCVIDGGPSIIDYARPGPRWFINSSAATSQTQIRFTTITCANPSAYTNGIGERNYFAFRCEIEKSTDLFAAYPSSSNIAKSLNIKIHGCYGHDMIRFAPDYANKSASNPNGRAETHNDWIQAQGGADIDIYGNHMHAYHHPTLGTQPIPVPHEQIAAVMITPIINPDGSLRLGPVSNVTIRNNWIYGGQQAINAGSDANDSRTTIDVTDNIFDRGAQPRSGGLTYAIAFNPPIIGIVTGNTYEDGVAAIRMGA